MNGSPPITTRSNPTPDFESLCRNGSRAVAPSSSSSIDAATGRAVSARIPAASLVSLRAANQIGLIGLKCPTPA